MPSFCCTGTPKLPQDTEVILRLLNDFPCGNPTSPKLDFVRHFSFKIRGNRSKIHGLGRSVQVQLRNSGLIHLQIVFFVASGGTLAERLPVQVGGACIVFACTFAGGYVLRQWEKARPRESGGSTSITTLGN